jgi:DNA-binding transcriptional regulator YhcF (GntR family)
MVNVMDVCIKDRKSKVSAGMQLAGRVKELIASNELKVGQKLPTTEELSKIMGVSSHTVQKAMEILGNQGLIDGAPGRGRYISSRQTRSNGGKSQEELIRISVANLFQTPKHNHPTDRFRVVSAEGVFAEASKLKINAVVVPEFYYTSSVDALIENMKQTSSQGVLWLYPTAFQWAVVRELEKADIPAVITTRSRISEKCACVEGDYESGGFIIGNHFTDREVDKVVLFPGCDPHDDSRREEVLSQWPNGIQQGIARAFGLVNGEITSKMETYPLKNSTQASNQIMDKLNELNDSDGVIFIDSFHMFDFLQMYGQKAVDNLNRLNVVVIANKHLFGNFLQYRDKLDFYVLEDPLKEMASFAVQKLAGLIHGYLANTSTLVKPNFNRFRDIEIC